MTSPDLFLGIDIGSSSAKALIVDETARPVGRALVTSGMDFTRAARAARDKALGDSGASSEDLKCTVATGYGRRNAAPALTRSEISCHARGAFHAFPEPITVVDIGGQDNKVIRVDQGGNVDDFAMNRKCAAGTGIFLEEIARRIDVPLSALNDLAEKSTEAIELGSFCTVFTFTEIIALAREGKEVPDMVRAAYASMARRIMEMAPLSGKIAATGGVVAHNPVLGELLKQACGLPVFTPPEPQFTGALGAALHALDHYTKNREKNHGA